MQKLYNAVKQALVRVQDFLNENQAVLGTVNTSTARSTLDQVIGQLTVSASNQGVHTQLSSGARAEHEANRRKLLVYHMRGIVRVAKAQAGSIPALASFRAPSTRQGTPALLDAADQMAKVAELHHDVFAGALGGEYLAQFQAAAKDVLTASSDGQTSRAKRVGATASLSVEVSRGRHAVQVLDVLVQAQLADNAELLAEWDSRRKVVVASPSSPAAAGTGTPTGAPTVGSAPTVGAQVASPVVAAESAHPTPQGSTAA